jgi:hypothetical protein
MLDIEFTLKKSTQEDTLPSTALCDWSLHLNLTGGSPTCEPNRTWGALAPQHPQELTRVIDWQELNTNKFMRSCDECPSCGPNVNCCVIDGTRRWIRDTMLPQGFTG